MDVYACVVKQPGDADGGDNGGDSNGGDTGDDGGSNVRVDTNRCFHKEEYSGTFAMRRKQCQKKYGGNADLAVLKDRASADLAATLC